MMKSSPQLEIEVMSRHEASEILCSPDRCGQITYLLSIGDQTDPFPEGYENVQRRLRLLVADVVTEEGATEEDVLRIIQVAQQFHLKSGKVLIHCEAGVSRSTAAALIMYACWFGPGREREAMRRVIDQRPIAIPNPRMVAIADKLLGLEGRLLQALGRGIT